MGSAKPIIIGKCGRPALHYPLTSGPAAAPGAAAPQPHPQRTDRERRLIAPTTLCFIDAVAGSASKSLYGAPNGITLRILASGATHGAQNRLPPLCIRHSATGRSVFVAGSASIVALRDDPGCYPGTARDAHGAIRPSTDTAVAHLSAYRRRGACASSAATHSANAKRRWMCGLKRPAAIQPSICSTWTRAWAVCVARKWP